MRQGFRRCRRLVSEIMHGAKVGQLTRERCYVPSVAKGIPLFAR